jgi:type II secretion system protein H
MTGSGGVDVGVHRSRGFTLIELIFVMVLLIVVASMVAPRMSSFFRGRALSAEAQRLLSLTHYAQSRAVSEGVPVLLWIDASKSTYGVEVQAGHEGDDDRGSDYIADPSITLEVPTVTDAPVSESEDERLGLHENLPVTDAPVSESEDERLGLHENLPAIRFTPDGFFDEMSVRKIILRQGEEGALELVPKANRLGYEIRPFTSTN